MTTINSHRDSLQHAQPSLGYLCRHAQNPIIHPADMPVPCSSVFNAGAVLFEDKVLLLLRVEDLTRENQFFVATSDDGIHFDIADQPIDYPLRPIEQHLLENRFDMRITPLDGTYYVTHASWLSGHGCCIGMARTNDFKRFEPVGPLSLPSNRNAALFPEKIQDRYARLERPQDVDGSGRVWIRFSHDLLYWGDAYPLDLPQTPWNRTKSGAGAIPLKTKHGWLCVYHGASKNCSTLNYYLGAALLDLDEPQKVIAAPREFILHPQMPYECAGQVPNVVFTNGAVLTNKDILNIYYGAADTCICLAQISLDQLVEFCLDAKC